jgi:stringent starvation protein B
MTDEAGGPDESESESSTATSPDDSMTESSAEGSPSSIAPHNVVRVDFKRTQRTSPSDPTAPQKYAVFSRFIMRGKVMVTLDARRPGVSVPRQFADEQQLNLDFSERFGLPDFVYDERGVRASLSFKRQPFFCDVPWSAVYALYSHVDAERLTWARSLPAEILEQLPEASVEHLERVLELQVDRLLRSAREQKEREIEKARDDDKRSREALFEAPESSDGDAFAKGAPEDAKPAPSSTDGPPDGDKPPPPPTRPGLRLVKS